MEVAGMCWWGESALVVASRLKHGFVLLLYSRKHLDAQSLLLPPIRLPVGLRPLFMQVWSSLFSCVFRDSCVLVCSHRVSRISRVSCLRLCLLLLRLRLRLRLATIELSQLALCRERCCQLCARYFSTEGAVGMIALHQSNTINELDVFAATARFGKFKCFGSFLRLRCTNSFAFTFALAFAPTLTLRSSRFFRSCFCSFRSFPSRRLAGCVLLLWL